MKNIVRFLIISLINVSLTGCIDKQENSFAKYDLIYTRRINAESNRNMGDSYFYNASSAGSNIICEYCLSKDKITATYELENSIRSFDTDGRYIFYTHNTDRSAMSRYDIVNDIEEVVLEKNHEIYFNIYNDYIYYTDDYVSDDGSHTYRAKVGSIIEDESVDITDLYE